MNKRSKYMIGSDDEEEERTIKSGATKRAEALEKVLEEMRKHANISDFNALDNDFNKMELEIKKAADQMFEEKGAKLPVRVLKVFMLVEDTINDVNAAQKKKMTKINSVSYNKLKQRFKKYLAAEGEGETTYEKQLLRYREQPPKEKEEPEEEEEEEKAEVQEEVEAEAEAEEVEKVQEASEEDSESDEEIKAEKAAAKAEARKEAAKAAKEAKAAEGEEEEYYDEEEYDAEEAGSESEGKVDIDTEEIDIKLRTKFGFLFKERDEMIPEERRWKWVKKEALPEDLSDLIEKLSRKKGKKAKVAPTEATKDKTVVAEGAENAASEFVTQVRTRNDLQLDYTVVQNVRERLEILTQERFKGKFNMQFHVQVLSMMAEQMPAQSTDI